MALSKCSTGRQLAIKYLLAEALEDEETLLEIVRKPRAKIHDVFKLSCEEGLFNKLIIGHLREDKKKLPQRRMPQRRMSCYFLHQRFIFIC